MAYTPEQRRNIALAERLSRNAPPRVRQALLEAMDVESSFRQLPYGDRDSVGVLQQRPSQGWGPATESAATDIGQFLRAATRANRGFRGTPGQLAQAVQRSAFPGRYDQKAGEVAALLKGSPAGSGVPALDIARSISSPQGANGGDTGAFKQAVASYLIQNSNALAHGERIDTNSILDLALARQQLAQPSAPAQQLAQRVGGGGGGQAPVIHSSGIQFSGKPLSGEKPDFLNKITAAVKSIGGTQIHVISGYRSPAHNAAIGGAKNSNHIYGRAMDAKVYIPGHGWQDLGTALAPVAPKFGLRSGATFNYGGRPDTPHVDDGFNQHH